MENGSGGADDSDGADRTERDTGGAHSGDSTAHIDRLRALHHAATDLMAADGIDAVYATVVETARSVLGFDFCTVFTRVDDGYRVAASSHYREGTVLEMDGSILDRTFERDESMVVDDVKKSDTARPTRDSYRSALSVPIGGEAVLQTVATTPETYDRTDLELAELLALHADAAIVTHRSRGMILEQKRQITQLHDVAAEIGGCEDHGELFELLREASERILGFDWCSLYVIEDGRFVVAMASEASPVEPGDHPFPDGTSKAREVLETGESLLVEDVTEIEGARPTSDRMRAAMTVPVGTVGVFNAAHETPGAFDAGDLELAELLTEGVADAYARIDAQERLRRRTQELATQNERLDRFASTVSHDIRNPLNVAIGYTELAAETGDPDAFDRIRAAHDRIETMIKELLVLTRKDFPLEDRDAVPVAAHVREAWDSLHTAEATLQVTIPESYTVQAHPTLLSHVLENLLNNAITHNDSPITVTVEPIETDGRIRGFAVEDTGHGIAPDIRGKVFDHGYTTERGGTGFGLAIVEEFIEAHGWEISASESDGDGARFEIDTG
ncbi:GAF domain-containing sensor histidine kinase [Halorubrum vacuolatum]|uniref:histidine kinase n=1 Tax=Halorubrum vacuolatum TaxID=63740 RepID=A0A238XZP7_HALVU|nr:GAF domain-containing protein [Halorubrum vacuolatum]SNR64367.1 GAF domain-containing protein [Halorubrum vacuolatum]